MATLVAIGYPDETTAERAQKTVQELQADLIIQASQVAAISRDAKGDYHVHTNYGGAATGAGAMWGGFWGLLFGLLFFIPFAGLAIGAGMGVLFGPQYAGRSRAPHASLAGRSLRAAIDD
jgi:uncharacterized membrane protein